MTNLCHRIFVVWLLHAAILCGLYNRFLLRFSPLFLRPEQNPEQSQVPRLKRRAEKSSWKASDKRGQRQFGTSLEESFCASNCLQLLPAFTKLGKANHFVLQESSAAVKSSISIAITSVGLHRGIAWSPEEWTSQCNECIVSFHLQKLTQTCRATC